MTKSTWVGLDVHQDSITAAILRGESNAPEVVRLSGDLMKVRRLFRRLSAEGTVHSCYEASGAGFVLHRVLANDGFHCEVIAPSLIPKKPGDRRKTDRLDAVNLAHLYRGGHLTPVHVPSSQQVELRQLLRLRGRYQQQAKSTKLRITSVLRTHGHRFTGTRSLWTKKHLVWLQQMRQSLIGPLQIVIASELEHLEYLEMQRHSFDAEIERVAQSPTYRRSVEALCCFRGIQTLTAMTILCEVGDIPSLRLAPAPRGLPRPGAERTLLRRCSAPRSHHQSGQLACSTASRRGGLEQPPSSRIDAGSQPSTPRATARDRRHRAQGPAPALEALPPSPAAQACQRRRHGGRPRDVWLHLGRVASAATELAEG